MKIEGSASGSISQRHGSADPDPHQNVMDPQHGKKELCHKKKILRKIIVMWKTGEDIAPFDGSTYLRVVSPPPFLARLASFFSRLALYSFSLARMKSSFLAFSVPNVF